MYIVSTIVVVWIYMLYPGDNMYTLYSYVLNRSIKRNVFAHWPAEIPYPLAFGTTGRSWRSGSPILSAGFHDRFLCVFYISIFLHIFLCFYELKNLKNLAAPHWEKVENFGIVRNPFPLERVFFVENLSLCHK